MKRFVLIMLMAALAVPFSSCAQNLISNPGFEDGLNEWNTGAWGGAVADFSVSSQEKQEGAKSARVEITAAYPDDGGRAYLRKQGLRIQPDVPHTLEFHLMSNSGKEESIVVSMYSHTNIGSKAWGSAYKTDVTFQGDGQWHKISLHFTPTALAGDPDFDALGLLFGFAKSTGVYYMDSVSLVPDVAPEAKVFHVSVDGDDANPGTMELPFKSIAKAAELAAAGDTVFIHAGTYEETLVPKNSGLPDLPIVFTAYPGDKVVITAMHALSNWQLDHGSIYKTTVDWSLGQKNMVMHGDVVLDLARWPNNVDGDPFTPDSKRNTGGSESDVIINAYLTQSEIPAWDWANGGSIWFYGDAPGSGWLAWKAFIKSSSAGKVTFDLDKNPDWIRTYHYPAKKGDFYLEGIKEALDFDNEWYFDEATKTLYVQLKGGATPEDGEVSMRKRELCIDLNNKSYVEVSNLAVFGGSIEINGTGNTIHGVSSLYGNYTRGITTGFSADSHSVLVKGNKNVIEKCEIGFGAGSGVYDLGTETQILNCYIHDFNFLGFYNAPVNARGQKTLIKNNTITRGGRDALQIPANNSTVEYNDISFSNLIADDCGLLYTLGADRNIEIHHNWFHDAESRGSLKKAAGIYLDNDAGNYKVHHNVVWNTEWTNIQINWNGTNIDIFNNTLWNGSAVMGAWHKEGTAFTNVRVWNNLSDDSNWEPQSDKKNNLTVAVNPFVNSEAGDFSLKAGSEPIDAGIVISGITDGYKGAAPDVGAYEYGAEKWIPGITWDKQLGPNGNGCYGLPGEACKGVPTAINRTVKRGFSVFPNPVSGQIIQVQLPQVEKMVEWKIYSINGTLLKAGKQGAGTSIRINAGGLPTGVYLLSVKTATAHYSSKIVKQ